MYSIISSISSMIRQMRGQQMIETALFRIETRDKLTTIYDEIDTIICLRCYDSNAINTFRSSVGDVIRFYIKNRNPRNFTDCEIYEWGGWSFFRARVKFEWSAWRRGLKRIYKVDRLKKY